MSLFLPSNRLRRVLIILAFLLAGCPGDSADDEHTDTGGDAGVDVDRQIPSVESIDFDGTEPASPPSRIYVESATKRAVIAEDPPLPIQEFFTEEDARRILPDSDLETVDLSGQTRSPSQNSVRYAPPGDGEEHFGIALQVWDLADVEISTSERLAELREQFLNVSTVEHDELPDGSFTSRRSGIRSLVFTSHSEPYLFILSCDDASCPTSDLLLDMGVHIANKS